MAVADFFSGFQYKWAQAGSVFTWDDAQYKQGWSTIGSTPPSVEQFNRVQQILDEKTNWLFAQISTAAAAKGITLTAADLQGLKKILDAYAPSATTSVRGQVLLASNADVTAGVNTTNAVTPASLMMLGPFRGVSVYSAAGSYSWSKPSGVTRAWVIVTGSGAAGGTGSGYQTSTAARGGGGGAGGTAMSLVDVSGVSSVSVTVGVGGNISDPNGKTSSFGSYCSATGGTAGAAGTQGAIAAAGGAPGIGAGMVAIEGGWGSDGGTIGKIGGSGDGGASFFGGGLRGSVGGFPPGGGSGSPGAGGGGFGLNERGAGQRGIVIIQY